MRCNKCVGCSRCATINALRGVVACTLATRLRSMGQATLPVGTSESRLSGARSALR